MKTNLLLLFSLFFFSFSFPDYVKRFEKKINKEVQKIFKQKTDFEEVKLSTQISLGKKHTFYKLISNSETIGFININKVNACKTGGCDKPGLLNTARYDYFYYMAILDCDFSILKVVVLDYQSEYGFEICSKFWLKQFVGKNGKPFVYDKNIDAISGATVSVYGMIHEMNALIRMTKELRKQI